MVLLTSTGTVALYRDNETSGADNDRIQLLVESISEAIENFTDRKFESTAVIAERHTGTGTPFLILKFEPVLSVEEIRQNGEVVPSGNYFTEDNGIVELISGTSWSQTRNAIEVDYTHGYATTPADIERAATTQVAYEHLLQSDNRLGDKRTVFEEGGTNTYITDDWHPTVLHILDRYRRVS